MKRPVNSIERTVRRVLLGGWFSLYQSDICSIIFGLETSGISHSSPLHALSR